MLAAKQCAPACANQGVNLMPSDSNPAANSILREVYPVYELYQALRTQLLDALTDDDLRVALGGETAP
jgi:hypothetical protein